MANCTREACLRRARARGLCTMHYEAARRGTIPMPAKPHPKSDPRRYDLLVNPDTDRAIRTAAKKLDEPRTRVATRWLEDAAKARR